MEPLLSHIRMGLSLYVCAWPLDKHSRALVSGCKNCGQLTCMRIHIVRVQGCVQNKTKLYLAENVAVVVGFKCVRICSLYLAESGTVVTDFKCAQT